jgi:hypothetical protein
MESTGRTIWKPFNTHFERSLSKLKEHRILIEDSARAAFIEEAKQEWEATHLERLLSNAERQEARESRKAIQLGHMKADMHYTTSSKFYEESTRHIEGKVLSRQNVYTDIINDIRFSDEVSYNI